MNTQPFLEAAEAPNCHLAARILAAAGIAVFPCRLDKTPYTRHGFKDASKDIATVNLWWMKWPDALLGVPTGEVNGFVVLDLDVRPNKNGKENILHVHGEPPSTFTIHTPQRGWHLYYRYPGQSVKNSASVIAGGVDVRGDGGYVVVPPSRTNHGQYVIESRTAVADMPEWMRDGSHLGSSLPVFSLSQGALIEQTQPRAFGERNAMILRLARGLKFECGLANAAMSELYPIVHEWHRRALPHIRTKDFTTTWREFKHAWRQARSPLSSTPLRQAIEMAKTARVAIPKRYSKRPAWRRLFAVVACLAYQQRGIFYVSCWDAPRHLGIGRMTAWRALTDFKRQRFIILIECGTRYKATRYKWNGAPPILEFPG